MAARNLKVMPDSRFSFSIQLITSVKQRYVVRLTASFEVIEQYFEMFHVRNRKILSFEGNESSSSAQNI